MSVQQFCLRWNNHQPNFISVCSSLLHNGTLVDVTLAAEGRQLQAHKIVLSACSSYFQTLFTTNPCQHPIVILKDVQYDDLKTMVDFMYYGEVNVSQEQLPHILKTAEMLKIKGLAEMPTDPANLTKSDSKLSGDPGDVVGSINGGTIPSGNSVANGPGGNGIGNVSSGTATVTDQLWGSAESQFQQQQPQQQQHHNQQLQQQQQQHQQQSHHSQQQQQQQQLHAQLQNSQTQTSQQVLHQHPQHRRTPSPLCAGASPALRRKRLRKSSNNGGGSAAATQANTVERTISDDQHTAALEASAAASLSLSQMNQLSFNNTTNGSLGGLAAHSIHTAKLLKENSNNEIEPHPQDSDSLEENHAHMHMQIKPEVDISSVQQSIPLDISGATTPSEHEAPNTQTAHTGNQRVSRMRNDYPAQDDRKCVRHRPIGKPNERIVQVQSQQTQQLQLTSTKRNRTLIRQPRVKRDSMTLFSAQVSPEPSATTTINLPSSADFSSFNIGSDAMASVSSSSTPHPSINTDNIYLSTSHHNFTQLTEQNLVAESEQDHPNEEQQISYQQQQQPQQTHLCPYHSVPHHRRCLFHHHHCSSRIERHSSEPTPGLVSPVNHGLHHHHHHHHIMSASQNTPTLIKQHSDPLPPRSYSHYPQSAEMLCSNKYPLVYGEAGSPAPSSLSAPSLQRQYSHPIYSGAVIGGDSDCADLYLHSTAHEQPPQSNSPNHQEIVLREEVYTTAPILANIDSPPRYVVVTQHSDTYTPFIATNISENLSNDSVPSPSSRNTKDAYAAPQFNTTVSSVTANPNITTIYNIEESNKMDCEKNPNNFLTNNNNNNNNIEYVQLESNNNSGGIQHQPSHEENTNHSSCTTATNDSVIPTIQNLSILATIAPSTSKFRSSKSASAILVTDQHDSDAAGSMSQSIEEQTDSNNDITTNKKTGNIVKIQSNLAITERLPILRVRSEELQGSTLSSKANKDRDLLNLENQRSSHCPVIRPGPALGCNYCWNTIDSHGRILRRKTKYHCPECQTNLCIVPCFQEYHERLNGETGGSSRQQQQTTTTITTNTSLNRKNQNLSQTGRKGSRNNSSSNNRANQNSTSTFIRRTLSATNPTSETTSAAAVTVPDETVSRTSPSTSENHL